MEIFEEKEQLIANYKRGIKVAQKIMWRFTGFTLLMPLTLSFCAGVPITSVHVSPVFYILIILIAGICAMSYKKPYMAMVLFDIIIFLELMGIVVAIVVAAMWDTPDFRFVGINILLLILLLLLSIFMSKATRIARRYEKLIKSINE